MTDLGTLSHAELVALFGTLEAPALDELDGEYAARLLAQKWPGEAALQGFGVSNPLVGRWLGKAFNGTGQGYNFFEKRGHVVRDLSMVNAIAPSRWDGKPSFQLVYSAFPTMAGRVHVVDEVRRVAPGLYLGFGTYGFTRSQRMRPLPFELAGPNAAYRGDIAQPREGFDLTRALQP